MKITKNEFLNLMQTLNAISSEKGSKRFAYAVSRNVMKLRMTQSKALDGLKASPKFEEYNKRLSAICEKYPKPDAQGNPIEDHQTAGRKVPDKTNPDYIKQTEALAVQYAETLNDEDYKRVGEGGYLDEPIDVEVYQVTIREFPESISSGQMFSLDPMIKETEAEMDAWMDEGKK